MINQDEEFDFDCEDSTKESVDVEALTDSSLDSLPAAELLTDENISDEDIDKFKSLGLAKPPHVSWGRWMGPRDLKSRHEHIIHLSALGMTNRQIAQEFGMSDMWMSTILKTPKVAEAVRIKREQYFAGDHRNYIQSLVHKSFEVIEGILVNPNEKGSTRLDAAKYVADQTIGKAQQVLEVKGGLLTEFLVKLDKSITEREVSSATETEKVEKHKDPVDAFVEELIPETLVIGKRNE